MKDQILYSTKNMIKYINVNMVILCNIFKKMSDRYMEKKQRDIGGIKLMEKFSKALLHIEFFATNKRWKDVNDLYIETIVIYKMLKFINRKINLNHIEKKIIKVVMVYLLCVIKLLKENENFNKNIDRSKKVSVRLRKSDSVTDSTIDIPEQ
jgi:hypothetical protein